MNPLSELTTRAYWQGYWDSAGEAQNIPRGFEYFDEVAKVLPTDPGLSFLEIGCAPGAITAEFCCRQGYEAHGVDYAADPAQIDKYLRSNGVKVGAIHRADFRNWDPGRKYDIVASFGFIEHFERADVIADRHFELVRPGGYVVITLPHFAHGQKVLHWAFNKEILRYHNTRCMNLAFMKGTAKRNRAEILLANYVGGHFRFNIRNVRRSWLMERVVWRPRPLWDSLNRRFARGSNPWFSPYIVAVFQAL
jgi:2-polyprenyl-3-methyl-5-hydroxy-6-metoxy-1,4-benzoquinol methylase